MYSKFSFSNLHERLSENIKSLYASNPVLKEIENLDPVFAGGYPMALLFAPRDKAGKIGSYYTDYDIYFQNPDNCSAAIEIIKSNSENHEQFSTENAETLTTWSEDPKQAITYQVVTKFNYSSEDVVDTFDFTNCAIAFTPLSETFTCHPTTIRDHLDKKLNLHNAWMLDKLLNDELTEDQITTYACVQIARFKKYMYRWDYKLSDKSWNFLIEVYNKFPHILSQKNIPLVIDSGPYNGFSYIARENQNIWTAIQDCLEEHPFYKDFVDQHLILKGQHAD